MRPARSASAPRRGPCAATALLSLLAATSATAAPTQVLVDVDLVLELTPLPRREEVLSVAPIPRTQSPAERDVILASAPAQTFTAEFLGGLDLFGLMDLAWQFDPDPLLNVRVEITNTSDTRRFFGVDLRFPTEVTSGPTLKDTFANLELIDAAGDGSVALRNTSTFFSVIDDPGTGDTINGFSNLGSSFFYTSSTPGKATVFDSVGIGPNADSFGGPGFNWMRFAANGELGPGDKLVITAMGCYYAAGGAPCPQRFELQAVPLPPAGGLLLAGLAGLAAGRWHRRSTAGPGGC